VRAQPEAAARIPARDRAGIARAFLRRLDAEGIAWALLGDPRELAADVDRDIDLCVDPRRLRELPSLVLRFAAEQGLRLVQACWHEWNAISLVLAWRTIGTGELQLLQLDACGDPGRSARRFLRADDVLARRRPAPGDAQLRVPAAEHAFIAYLLKRIDKLDLSRPSLERLRALRDEDPASACAQAQRRLGARAARCVIDALEQGSAPELRERLPWLRRCARRRLRRSALALVREAVRRLGRIRHPVGFWFALLGPDGAGKSTIAEGVARELAPLFRSSRLYHLRPHLGSGADARPPVLEPHAQAPRGRMASLAKLGLWWADCTAGYLLDLFPRLVRAQLLIFDRSCLDLQIDPRRYRYAGPPWAARWLAACTFTPPLVALLDAPLAVIHARKREVSAAEVQRQREAYRQLVEARSDGAIVEAARPIASVVASVVDRVLERMAERVARRLGRLA
jgi:thymidylate kinase